MSVLRKLFGFCCCSPPVDCDVCADDFARSDGTDISTGSACGWTETTGNWTISSGALSITTTNAKATCNTNSPNAPRTITVKVRGSNANNLALVYVGDWRIEVRFSTTAGRVQILNSGGTAVDTSSSTLNLALNTFYTLNICYTGLVLRAEIVGVSSSYVGEAAAITNLTNGVGSGGTVSGSVSFDDWNLDDYDGVDCLCQFSPTGGERNCLYCTGNEGPHYYEIVLEGVADGTCTDCDNLDGVYLLEPTVNIDCFAVTDNTACCCWRAPTGSLGPDCSDIYSRLPDMTLQICAAYDSFPAGIRARLYKTDSGGFAVWQHTASTPIDCIGIDELSISLQTAASYTECNFSGATLTVTAI